MWTAVASLFPMMIVATGGSREHRHPGNGRLIMAGASVVAYIIGEGLTDAANVETQVEVTTEEEV